ncbi:MAG: minor capsid protein [Pseudonocardia sp.]|nr:minor capsid protein [Pseudonocardia sp.]
MTWLDGLAQHLAAVPALELTWSPDAAYPADAVGIVLEHVPPAPDQVVVLTGYEGEEANSLTAYDTPRLQVRVRGTADPAVSRARARLLYDHLHGLGPVQVPDGTWLQLVIGRGSGPAYMGQDDAGRHEHVTNFNVDMHNPNRRGRSA